MFLNFKFSRTKVNVSQSLLQIYTQITQHVRLLNILTEMNVKNVQTEFLIVKNARFLNLELCKCSVLSV